MSRQMIESGIEWIGEIPFGWKVIPQKYVMHKKKTICEQYNGEDIISLSMQGVHVRDLDAGGKMPTTFNGYQYVEPEDLLLCLFDIDVTPRCVGVVHDAGLTSPAYSRFIVHDGYFNRYYDYLLRFIDDEKILVHLAKNLRSSLTETDFGMIKTIIPPLREQHMIVDYLDQQCSHIDSVLEQTRTSIEEYKKLKQAVVSQAVTKGVRGDRAMKDSEVEWLGNIPADWNVYRIANLYDERSESGLEELPILTVSINTGVSDHEIADADKDRVFFRSEDRTKYKRVYPGDLAYNMMRAWQGAFGAVRVDGMVSPAYVVAKPKKNIELDSRYMEALLRTSEATEEMHRYSRGIVDFRLRLYWPEFKNIHICLPSIEEQIEIADYIDEKVAAIDDLITKKEAFAVELENYKKSMIYEYVTGKKEVL